MIRLCRTSRFWPRSLRKTQPFSFWRQNTAGTADSFRSTVERSAFGRKDVWWNFANNIDCDALVDLARRFAARLRYQSGGKTAARQIAAFRIGRRVFRVSGRSPGSEVARD